MPCARNRAVEASELDTAASNLWRAAANASMKWLAVLPVPTPTTASRVSLGSMASKAAAAAACFSASRGAFAFPPTDERQCCPSANASCRGRT